MASRKDEKYERKQEQIESSRKFTLDLIEDETPDVVARIAQSDADYQALANGPDAPEWMRVTVNPAFVAPLKTAGEIESRIAALDAEHEAAMKKLEDVRAEQVKALNDQLAQRKADDEAAEAASIAQLPARLEDTLAKVRSFHPRDEVRIEASPVNYVDRGREALNRAVINADLRERRSKGETNVPDDVPEPVYPEVAGKSGPVTVSSKQAELKARVAPALAAAAAFQAQIAQWTEAVGASFDSLHVAAGEHPRPVVDSLMQGLPPTQKNLALVTSLLNNVRDTLTLKNAMAGTIDRESREVESAIAQVENYGPMTSRGDKSAGFYDFERTLHSALSRLATVTPDSVAQLWNAAKFVTEKLARIAEIRHENADAPVAKLEWQGDQRDMIDATMEATRRTASPGGSGRPQAITDYALFGGGSK